MKLRIFSKLPIPVLLPLCAAFAISGCQPKQNGDSEPQNTSATEPPAQSTIPPVSNETSPPLQMVQSNVSPEVRSKAFPNEFVQQIVQPAFSRIDQGLEKSDALAISAAVGELSSDIRGQISTLTPEEQQLFAPLKRDLSYAYESLSEAAEGKRPLDPSLARDFKTTVSSVLPQQ